METASDLILLALAGAVAGAVNAIAGGGPILTLAGMMALGIDPRIANLTSTVALGPGQIVAGAMAWKGVRHRPGLAAHLGGSVALAIAVATIAGACGALLLLATDSAGFRGIVVWLVLAATAIYAWAGRSTQGIRGSKSLARWLFWPVSATLGIYGGYFGGGNSFLVLALLAASGLAGGEGGAVKNIVVAAVNAGAVVVFVGSGSTQWHLAIPLAVGGVLGSIAGARLLRRLRASQIRPIVIASGLFLAGWLAFR